MNSRQLRVLCIVVLAVTMIGLGSSCRKQHNETPAKKPESEHQTRTSGLGSQIAIDTNVVSLGDTVRVGPYSLGQSFSEVSDKLTKVGQEAPLLLPKAFEDEAVYEGQEITFLGTQWNTLVSVTGGQIYKIGIDVMSNKDLSMPFSECLRQLIKQIGDFTQKKRSKGKVFLPPSQKKRGKGKVFLPPSEEVCWEIIYRWDTDWEYNVVLTSITSPRMNGVNVFFTWEPPILTKLPKREVEMLLTVRTNNMDALKDFIEQGVNINWQDPLVEGETALHAAVRKGNLEIVTLLLQNGADINSKNYNGLTPLHVAAYCGRWEMASALIEGGAQVNAKAKDGITPLHAAAAMGNMETVRLLIDKGADVHAKSSQDGLTPKDFASREGHTTLVELFARY